MPISELAKKPSSEVFGYEESRPWSYQLNRSGSTSYVDSSNATESVIPLYKDIRKVGLFQKSIKISRLNQRFFFVVVEV